MIDLAKPVQRTGPVVFRDCGFCDGIGRPGCPNCRGTGRIAVDIHPFGTLEALVENIQMARRYLGAYADYDGHHVISDADVQHTKDRLEHVESVAQNLFQQLILLLPEEFDRVHQPATR